MIRHWFYRIYAAVAAIAAGVLAFTLTVAASIPDRFFVSEGDSFSIQSGIPAAAVFSTTTDSQDAAPASTDAGSSYRVSLRLLGVIPLKQVTVNVVEKASVIPCGTPFGIKMFTDGVVVVGMSDVDTRQGAMCPAQDAGLRIGDVIVSISGHAMTASEDVAAAMKECGGKPVSIEVRRQNMNFFVELTPAYSTTDGCYKLGAWVRDSSAGIGTMTFYDPDSMIFAGLGHAMCDMDTGEILPLMSGEIVAANIGGVTRGAAGAPGELRGSFCSQEDMGMLVQNGETGVYGKLYTRPIIGDPVPVAMRQQVQEGAAQILTTIDGQTPYLYDICIERVYFSGDAPSKNMVIRVTDPVLLEQSGGIVQGMSGSPILQNGMLIGAVTHVFVNDPTQGYGIFAENMLHTAQSTAAEQNRAA